MTERAIVCIHGIWVRPGIFWYVRRGLKPIEAPVYSFGYASIRQSLEESARSLQPFLDKLQAQRIDFIAHSLGGLLLLHYFSLGRDPRVAKVILMGTPLQGSAIARTSAQFALFKPLLGKNREHLQRGISQWSAPAETIMIAGTRSIGVGKLFPKALVGPNDGTVTVAETRHPKLLAHYQISASHSSMLYSREAVCIIREFLT